MNSCKINIPICLFALLCLFFQACKKLVDVPPPITGQTGATVFNSNATAIAAMTYIYSQLSAGNNSPATGNQGISIFAGLSADEFALFKGIVPPTAAYYYYRNGLIVSSPTVTPGSETWTNIYPFIFLCNSVVEGTTNNSILTPSIGQQLLGEAYFTRAFLYFYLANLYGDVPLALSSDYKVNSLLSRSSVPTVYQQILKDLNNARSLLSKDYLDGTLLNITTERVRPTSWAAAAMLARTYLFMGNWPDAEKQASAVIDSSSGLYQLNDSLNAVFLKNSSDAIWQLQPVNIGYNTPDASVFILPSPEGPSNGFPYFLSDSLMNSFEAGDLRRYEWIDSVTAGGVNYYYPYKYKINLYDPNSMVSEYLMVLRLSEQYLIRAEARAEEGNFQGAAADLNVVRLRAGLDSTNATDLPTFLSAIAHERQVELFTEWGHRWLDIKREGTIDAVMNADLAKDRTWQDYQKLYPLPLGDLQKDPNLIQNKGY